MNKASRLIKRRLALILVLLFSIESFAAVVGDNDGAAFITKAEFDSMKNDFQSQLDRYNSSLDNKIDGAIASYLAGVGVSKKIKIKSIWEQYNKSQPLVFYRDMPELKDMGYDDLRVGRCAVLLWHYVGFDGRMLNSTTTENIWSGAAFWNPFWAIHTRTYDLHYNIDQRKHLLYGENDKDELGNEWFRAVENYYSTLEGIVSLFGANGAQARSPAINKTPPYGKIVWPRFQFDMTQYTTNTSAAYSYSLDLGETFGVISIPCVVNNVWMKYDTTYVSPGYVFNNGTDDPGHAQMTCDRDNLINFTQRATWSAAYFEGGGEIWPNIPTIGSAGVTSNTGHRNYFAGNGGTPGGNATTPPNYIYSTSSPLLWDVSWASTEDSELYYMQPEIALFPLSRICNDNLYRLTNTFSNSFNGVPIVTLDNTVESVEFQLDVNISSDAGSLSNQDFWLILSDAKFSNVLSSNLIAAHQSGTAVNDHYFFVKLNTKNNPNKVTMDRTWVSHLKKNTTIYGRIYPVTTGTHAVANITDLMLELSS